MAVGALVGGAAEAQQLAMQAAAHAKRVQFEHPLGEIADLGGQPPRQPHRALRYFRHRGAECLGRNAGELAIGQSDDRGGAGMVVDCREFAEDVALAEVAEDDLAAAERDRVTWTRPSSTT